ncbi:Mannose-binding protein A [Myotis brandtii]|uniref:Mannose-binding protein A n=1 Tax=Myotis brandtii TaxID=109478 RepID=S7N506_MYOBR|nr:Mannose-binding protein A [Myotis brandtii]
MFWFVSLPTLLFVVTVSFSESTTCEDAQKACSVTACGIPVTNGTPGRDGQDGAKGKKENQVPRLV